MQQYVTNAAIWGLGGYLISKATGIGGTNPTVVGGMAAVASMIMTRYDVDAKRLGRKSLLLSKSSPTAYVAGRN